MENFELADELRNRDDAPATILNYLLQTMDDEEIINAFTMCPCCTNSMLEEEELADILEEALDAEDFLQLMWSIVEDRQPSPQSATPTNTFGGIEFANVQLMRERYPETVEAPTFEELSDLNVGDLVKVSAFGERFWNTISAIDGQMITATVANNLLTDKICLGDRIRFHRDNIYTIHE